MNTAYEDLPESEKESDRAEADKMLALFMGDKKQDEMFDEVQKPYHYNSCGEMDDDGRAVFEPIKVIESWGLGWGFCMGNALKYILRAPHKGSEQQDLEKALWYLERISGEYCVKATPYSARCDASDVVEAWGLTRHLETAVHAISKDDPTRAAHCVFVHLEELKGAEES